MWSSEKLYGAIDINSSADVTRLERARTANEKSIDDLLLTAQLSTGLLDIRRTTTDLAELVRESVADAQAEAGRRELQLSLNVTPHSIPVDADVVRLAQALDNVISNAIKFTPERGRVDVTLAQDAGRAMLTVADTGWARLRSRSGGCSSAFSEPIPLKRTMGRSRSRASRTSVRRSRSLPLGLLPERQLATAGAQERFVAA